MTTDEWNQVREAFADRVKKLTPSCLVALMISKQGFAEIAQHDYDAGDPSTWAAQELVDERCGDLLEVVMLELDSRFGGKDTK